MRETQDPPNGRRRVRVAVIGVGSWFHATYLPRLAERREEVDLVAACDTDLARLRPLARRWPEVTVTTDPAEALATAPDVCVVTSPAFLHHAHARAALDAGAHVLCEKPFTLTAADAWDLVAAAERVGREVVVAHGWHFTPVLAQARALLADHPIGPLEHATVHMSSSNRELLTGGSYFDASPDAPPRTETWTDPAVSGGGYAQSQLSHALGMFFSLTGERVRSAYAMMSGPAHARVEFHDVIAMRLRGGGIAACTGGSAHRGAWGDKHQLEIRLIGGKGQAIVDLHRELLWVYRPDGTDVTADLAPEAGRYTCTGPLDTVLDLALGRPAANHAPAELGARTVEALELAYRSAASGREEHAAWAVQEVPA